MGRKKGGKKKPAKTKSLLQNNPPPINSSSGTGAASRVFGIPELLEQILIQRAAAAVEESLTSLPVASLFVWQRINCTFRNTINSSQEIRNYMLLDPKGLHINGERVTDAERNHTLLAAVFDSELSRRYPSQARRVNRALYSMPTLLYYPLNYGKSERPQFEIEMSKKLGQRDASWRNIKVHVSSDQDMFLIRQLIMKLDTDFEQFGYFCDLRVEGTVTLGVVAEKLLSLRGRTNRQHSCKSQVFRYVPNFDDCTEVMLVGGSKI